MYSRADLRLEAREALDKVWFVQSLKEMERTDLTLSLCLTHSGGRRIFGIDREGSEWHLHPYGSPDKHESLPGGLETKPLLKFLARVEDLLLEHALL